MRTRENIKKNDCVVRIIYTMTVKYDGVLSSRSENIGKGSKTFQRCDVSVRSLCR